MRGAGGLTIAQDEASCIVFGMPKEAIACGAVERIVPLANIAREILRVAKPRTTCVAIGAQCLTTRRR